MYQYRACFKMSKCIIEILELYEYKLIHDC